MIEILLAILLGPLLWLVGAIVFDAVHWLLHLMLRSRSSLLRALARPHGVHHEWIDRRLVTNWNLQAANVWCHIAPEYLTQLAFTGLVSLILSPPFVVVLALLQTAVFLGILRARGRDVNHRPAACIDAHPAGWTTPPAYHALHHVWPDAHFSAYSKVVDWIVGGGTQIAGRRFAWLGPDSRIGAALRTEVERLGGVVESEPSAMNEVDVLVLVDANASLARPVEALIVRTRDHQLPPEAWALRVDAEDPLARHYLSDPRITFRTLLAPPVGPADLSERDAARAARRALFWIRRDAHFVALDARLGCSALRRFRRTVAAPPEGARLVRHRMEFVASAESPH